MLGRLLKGLFAGNAGAHECEPDSAARLNEEGARFFADGRLQEAAQAFQRAIEVDGGNADALANLGVVLARSGKVTKALAYFDRSLAIRPAHAETLANYALALREAGRYEDAIPVLEQVLRVEPGNRERWCDLALMHKEVGNLDEARRCCERVLDLDRGHNRAQALLAGIALDAGRFEEAEALMQQAEQTPEGAVLAAPYRAFLRLGRHEFAQGWEDYQSRKRVAEVSSLRPYPFPEWRGESLSGKRLLVYAEQGLGDEIMFASCVPDVARHAEEVVLECDPRLASLFSRSFPANVRLMPLQRKGARTLPAAELGHLDFRAPVGDLPRYFRRSAKDFPSRPFLVPDPERVAAWRCWLGARGAGAKFGLAWRGGLGKTRSRARSLSMEEDMAPLFGLRCISWFSLQFRAAPEEREALKGAVEMGPDFPSFDAGDYAELAAFVCALDGVVSVCGSTVHFAGALGVPTWVPTPLVPEWRYGYVGETMPWYSSVRLVRQERPGDWSTPMARIGTELTHFVS